MEFRDLKRQYLQLKTCIDKNIFEVLLDTNYISGKQVAKLEQQLAEYIGVKHCITCGNGTDAITIALMAWNIQKGDAVFVPDFTFFASGECPAHQGATPIFVDVDINTFNISPEALEIAICKVLKENKYTPKVVIAVDLFGLPANYHEIKKICQKYNLLLLEDAAQGFGGRINGKLACSFGDISTTSFFPAKPLGCYGDGGAIFTDNDEWAEIIRSISIHGKSKIGKYDNVRIGVNSRLDTIQAAILLAKFKAFKDYELDNINKVAMKYTKALNNVDVVTPIVPNGCTSSWAQYTIKLGSDIDREMLQYKLKEAGIPSMVYYSKPMHKQKAFEGTDSSIADCPNTDNLCRRVLSLPMHPYLTDEEILFVTRTLNKFV